jgi:hypothetical protein
MELILLIVAALGGSALFAFFRKKPSEKIVEYERKDAKLKATQEEQLEEIEVLNQRLKKIAEKAKNLKPKDAEDFWNDEDNS